MNELKVKVNPTIRKKYGIIGSSINFIELEKKIRLALAREKLDQIAKIAKETGLSKMTNDQINNIIKEARNAHPDR